MIKTTIASPLITKNNLAQPDSISPEKKERKKLLKLDAIRGFAAIYVLCHHTLPKETIIAGHSFVFFRYAQEAVILFFILSGFVIQYAYLTTSDKSFKSFFLKRFLRIYVPLLCVFAANYVMLSISEHKLMPIDLQSLTGNLLMLQQVSEIWHYPVLFKPFLDNQPLWTLAFEWWFYMIFFFVFNQFKEKASTVVYIMGIASAFVYLAYPCFVVRELMYLAIWWAGADVAKLYVNKKDINIKNLLFPLLSLSVITVILGCNILLYKKNNPGAEIFFASSPLIELRHFGFTVAALVIAIYWRKLKWKGFNYTFGLFQPLASISFALYISHWFMVSHATYLNAYVSNIYVKSLLYFIVCCVFCYLVERIIYPYVSKQVLACFSVKKKPFVSVE